jgi:hypothetical protein
MAGYLPSFDSSTALFRGSGAGVVPYSTCAETTRPGAIRTRRRFRQRGGKCPCMLGGGKRKQSRKNRGNSRKQRYSRKLQKQRGGAGYTFDMADMLMKEPARVTTACQMPRPPTQFGGSSNGLNKQSQSQIGGGSALVGSPIASMTESIGGTTQPSSALVYPATTAAYSFDLAGSKNLKGIYAAVAPMNGRVGPVSCRSRKRKGRKHA